MGGLMSSVTDPLFGKGPGFSTKGFTRQAQGMQRILQRQMEEGYGPETLYRMTGAQQRERMRALPQMRESMARLYARAGGSGAMPAGGMAGRMAEVNRAYAQEGVQSAERLALENELAKQRAMANAMQLWQQRAELWSQAHEMKRKQFEFKSQRDYDFFKGLMGAAGGAFGGSPGAAGTAGRAGAGFSGVPMG